MKSARKGTRDYGLEKFQIEKKRIDKYLKFGHNL
jgi:hypothetical protein